MEEETKYITEDEHEEMLQEKIDEIEKSVLYHLYDFSLNLVTISLVSLVVFPKIIKTVFNKWR